MPSNSPKFLFQSRRSLASLFIATVLGGCHLASLVNGAQPDDYFTIQVVDDVTGRGVPLVELKTVNNVRYYTDSAGVAAIREPGLMNQTVFFHIKSHGYEFPKDNFGYRGRQFRLTPGGAATAKIKRVNIAERLYRVTGEGIYRDSLLVGKTAPLKQPLLNAQVFGSDSVVNAVYRGKIYWFWGDTNRPSYPLGNFHVPGAVSRLPADGGLDPERGIDLQYFMGDNGLAKQTARMPGSGPTWINGLVVLGGGGDPERLFASYVKVKGSLSIYKRGLAEFNDRQQRFEKVAEFDMNSPLFPHGHPFRHRNGEFEYVYFGNPFPLVRVPATPSALQDLSQYEAYTCLKQGSRSDSPVVERKDGKAVFTWKTDTIAYTPKLQNRLIQDGVLEFDEGLFQFQAPSGKPLLIHSGSVRWNDHRKRWIMIGLQSFGTSLLGEIWYSEAENLVGPWTKAHKIVTHENYSFYNPKQHAMLDKAGGRYIFFEGTYTHTFSGNKDQTPRYDYNQVMYKLDLADPRLR